MLIDFLAGLAIPDVSGICPAAANLLFSGWFVGSSDVGREIEEEESVPPVQHQPGQGMHYGLLETRLPNVPAYVPRVDYRGKGMTRRARDERRVDPRGLPKVQYDHRFQIVFHLDFYSSVILTRNPVIARSQWIDW